MSTDPEASLQRAVSRPGVQYVSNDEAARFDERINEKRNRSNMFTKSNNNSSSSKGAIFDSQRKIRQMVDVDDWGESHVKPPSRPTREESDMAAKNRARASSSSAKIVRPIRLDDDDDDDGNNRNNADMQAKRRAKAGRAAGIAMAPRPSSAAGRSNSKKGDQLASLDRDIEAKNQARRSIMGGGAKKAPAKLTTAVLTEEAENKEDTKKPAPNSDEAAKNRARSNKGPAMIPGISFEETVDVDDMVVATKKPAASSDAAAKTNARSHAGPALIPGAVFEERGDGNRKAAVSGEVDVDEDIDVDTLAKRNAAAASPRYISIDVDDDDDLEAQKNLKTGSGIGMVASASAQQSKQSDAMLGRINAQEQALFEGKQPSAVDGKQGAGVDGKGGSMDGSTPSAGEFNTEYNELAVATAVTEEEDDDAFIPAAVEYDPNSKPPLLKNRRFRLWGCFGCFMVCVIIAAIVTALQLTKNSGNDDVSGPTMAPTTFRESLGIQEQIETFVGSANLEDLDSPFSQALEWLLYDDPQQLPPDAENLLQRYILAVFYIQTSVDGPWRSCNPPLDNETSHCFYQQVTAIYPFVFDEVPWVRWLSNETECDWAGVRCENNNVVSLSIPAQKLSGGFPEELTHLPFLDTLDLPWNDLSGPIPDSLPENMKQLSDLTLQHNFFNGTLPADIFAFENLQRVNLGGNRLTGTLAIPSEGPVASLQSLFIYENSFTGHVPSDLGRVSNLRFMRLQKNGFSGPLPTEIGQLSYLEEFYFQKTSFSGTIPSEVGMMSSLKTFRLEMTNMNGTIPDELYNVTEVKQIDLYDSQFSGTISTKIGQLTSLNVLRLRNNQFSGQLPSELGLLTELQRAWFQENDFQGEIPHDVCARGQDMALEIAADCLVSELNGTAELSCPEGCCMECCDNGESGEGENEGIPQCVIMFGDGL